MGASVIDSVERTRHIKEGDLLPTNLDHLPVTWRNLISLSYLELLRLFQQATSGSCAREG